MKRETMLEVLLDLSPCLVASGFSLGATSVATTPPPAVYWSSNPTLRNETLVVAGAFPVSTTLQLCAGHLNGTDGDGRNAPNRRNDVEKLREVAIQQRCSHLADGRRQLGLLVSGQGRAVGDRSER